MQIDKRSRAELKQFFVKNAIPTESNFADFIDAMLSQKDDGIARPPNDALAIEAAGDDAGSKKALQLYASFRDAAPAWVLSLNPKPGPGFNIGDGAGNSRLFIHQASGNVGIGTTTPQARLHVVGDADLGYERSVNSFDVPLTTGVYQNGGTNVPGDVPDNDHAWTHLFVARHSNTANQHELQIAASYAENARLFFRKIARGLDVAARPPWNELATRGENTFAGAQTVRGDLTVSAGRVGIGTGSPLFVLHVAAPGNFAGENSDGVASAGSVPIVAQANGTAFGILNANSRPVFALNIDLNEGSPAARGVPTFYDRYDGQWHPCFNLKNGTVTFPQAINATSGVIIDGTVAHIERDGAFYRNTDGQVYITVDDNLYIRDTGAGVWAAHFDTNSGSLELKGDLNVDGHYSLDGKIVMLHNGPNLQINWGHRYAVVAVEGLLRADGGFQSAAPKNFCIPHPLKPSEKNLVHACIEGPEAAVYYRGESVLVDGEREVCLPSYFEALTRKESRSVLVTPRLSERGGAASALAVTDVKNGSFFVRAIDDRNPVQEFYWEVKGVRADIEPLEVEPNTSESTMTREDGKP